MHKKIIHVMVQEGKNVPSFCGFKRLVSLLLDSCSLGLDVGHKTGALVNNSGAAVEMCCLNRLQGWMLRDEQPDSHGVKVNNTSLR